MNVVNRDWRVSGTEDDELCDCEFQSVLRVCTAIKYKLRFRWRNLQMKMFARPLSLSLFLLAKQSQIDQIYLHQGICTWHSIIATRQSFCH